LFKKQLQTNKSLGKILEQRLVIVNILTWSWSFGTH